MKEHFRKNQSKLVFQLSIILLISQFAFKREQKEEKITIVGENCQRCQENKSIDELYAHHILPKSYGGADKIENMMLLCSECHQIVDTLFEKGILANNLLVTEVHDVYPDMIKNRDKYNKATRRARV